MMETPLTLTAVIILAFVQVLTWTLIAVVSFAIGRSVGRREMGARK